MPNKIKPRRSYTTGAVPTTSDLDVNEIAISWADNKLFTKNSAGNIVSVTLGGSGSGLTWSSVPASAFATGTAGQIAYDGDFLYVAVGSNQWERAALSTWTPVTGIAGLQAWYDASDASTLFDATSGGSLAAADGGVARWQDKSGNGRHFTQSTSGSRPLRKTGVRNGLATLRFDGSDDFLAVPSSTALFNFLHNGDSTVFMVFKPGTSSDPNAMYWVMDSLTNGGSADGGVGAYLRWDDRASVPFNDQLIYVVGNNYPRFVGITPSASFTANSYLLASVVGNPQVSTIADRAAIRKNGGSALTLNTSSSESSISLPTGNATRDLTIGATAGTAAWFFNGDIAEIIMYDSALSDTDRASVETYLMQKWAIT